MKKLILSLLAVVSVISLGLTAFVPATAENTDVDTLTVTVPYTTEAADGEITAAEPKGNIAVEPKSIVAEEPVALPSTDKLLLNMLNLNFCYTDAFNVTERMAVAAAISLKDYAADIPGYGICVSKTLTLGFIKSFYGIDLNLDDVNTEYAPEGFIALPCYEVGTQNHEIVSITETEDGRFEVVSTVTFIYGGYASDFCTAVSHFVKNEASEYGFNLLDCTLL